MAPRKVADSSRIVLPQSQTCRPLQTRFSSRAVTLRKVPHQLTRHETLETRPSVREVLAPRIHCRRRFRQKRLRLGFLLCDIASRRIDELEFLDDNATVDPNLQPRFFLNPAPLD